MSTNEYEDIGTRVKEVGGVALVLATKSNTFINTSRYCVVMPTEEHITVDRDSVSQVAVKTVNDIA